MKLYPLFFVALVFAGALSALSTSGMGNPATITGSLEPLGQTSLEAEDPLVVSPEAPWEITAFVSIPLSASQTYTITNAGENPLNWAASSTVDWLEFSGLGSVNGTTEITVRTNSRADEKPLGTHQGQLLFENTDSGVTQTREVVLTVLPDPGQIEVIDSIEPTDDHALPFGTTSIGTSKTETIRIRNVDPENDLVIERILLRPAEESNRSISVTRTDTGSESTDEDSGPTVSVTDTTGSGKGRGPARPDWTREHDPQTILVRFKEQAGAGARIAAHDTLGGRVTNTLRRISLDVVELPPQADPRAIAAAYEANPAVEYVEPNYKFSIHQEPNDPRFEEQWNLNNTGQANGLPGADISALEAWQISRGSDEIIVAVIDSGIDYEHPDLAANMWVNPSPTFGDVHGATWLDGTGNVTSGDPMDDNGHGTHVAGILGAVGNNGTGIAGVNWNVRLMALKFLDEFGFGFTADAAAALDYAIEQGAHISNNSWGGGGFSQALKDMIAAAGEANQLFVAAAGNSGSDNDAIPAYPASFDLDNIISVASSNRNDERAFLSNYGANTVHLAAPGADILSTLPGENYAVLSGTSMAAPHVTGVAALMLAIDPSVRYSDIKETILETVTPLSDWESLVVSGGRLNAAAAVAEAVAGFRLPDMPALPLTLGPGRSLVIQAVFEPGSAGPHEAVAIIESQDTANPSVEISLSGQAVVDDLELVELEGIASEGTVSGPFDPDQTTYTLRNNGGEPVSWKAETSIPWLEVTPSSGMLSAGSDQVIEVTFNTAAAALPEGLHTGSIHFTNTSTNLVHERPVTLRIHPKPGRLNVTSSIGRRGEVSLRYGTVLPGDEAVETITVRNSHAENDLIIEDILLLPGYREDFAGSHLSGWVQDPIHSWELSSGQYEASLSGASVFMQSTYAAEVWFNGTFETRFERQGSGSNTAAMLLRASPDFNIDRGEGSAIVIGVSGSRRYFIARFIDGRFSWIQRWAESSALNSQSPNVIVASLNQNQLHVFANDQLLWSGEAGGLFRPGRVGLAGFTDNASPTTHRFDYVEVSEPLMDGVLPVGLAQSWRNARPADSEDYTRFDSSGPVEPLSTDKTARGETVTYSEHRSAQETFRFPDLPDLPLRLSPNESEIIPVLFKPVGEGVFAATIRLFSNDPNRATFDIPLSGSAEKDSLQLLPLGTFAAWGEVGGPFSPESMTYTLRNSGNEAVDWEAISDVPWLSLAQSSASLAGGASAELTVSINRDANFLERNTYTGTIDLVNTTTGFVRTIPVELDVLPPLCQAVKACGLEWITGGDAPWFGQDEFTFRSEIAAQSGPVGDNQESWIETVVEGPGELSFWWAVSSELNYDFLEFHINDSQQAAVSGESGWEKMTFALPEGEHTLSWIYIKDFIFDDGADTGWLDEVTWKPTDPNPLLETNETELSFGVVGIRSSFSRRLEITNPGDSTLSITSIDLPEGFSTDWQTSTISPGSSRDLGITFSPTELIRYEGRLRIESNATTGAHEVELVGSAAPSRGAFEMHNDEVISYLSGEEGAERHFFIEVPAGREWLELRIYGGTGDADLYARKGAAATLTEWDYAPLLVGNNETIWIDEPAAGSWFFMVHGYEDYEGVSLSSRFAPLDFNSWADLIELSADRRGLMQRHGPGSITTLEGYAFGMDPRTATGDDLLHIEREPGDPNQVRLTYRVHTEAADASVTLETSFDLDAWETAAPSTEKVLSESDGVEIREATFDTNDGPTFFRARIDFEGTADP